MITNPSKLIKTWRFAFKGFAGARCLLLSDFNIFDFKQMLIGHDESATFLLRFQYYEGQVRFQPDEIREVWVLIPELEMQRT